MTHFFISFKYYGEDEQELESYKLLATYAYQIHLISVTYVDWFEKKV